MGIHTLRQKKDLKVLGIMNGTSLDGIDFVFTIVKKSNSAKKPPKISYISHKTFSFPQALKNKLKSAARHDLKVNELSLLHHELGRFYAACFGRLKSNQKKIDLIGLHGQTVFHQAPNATMQIGESSYLSVVSKTPVISDFRVSDMALGGQGAPIASLFHQVIFIDKKSRVSMHNLGGISNLSLISSKGVEKAFDTGPANMLMDLCMQHITKGKTHFDKNGLLASQGLVRLDQVGNLLKHPYFKMKPPKSCGREEFGEAFLKKFMRESSKLSAADKMATLSEFTAWSIALSYQKYLKRLPEKIIFCGGGANNKHLLKRIQNLLPEVKIQTTADYGWPVSCVEGAAFALLAAYKAWGLNSNLHRTTGASRPTSMGKITEV